MTAKIIEFPKRETKEMHALVAIIMGDGEAYIPKNFKRAVLTMDMAMRCRTDEAAIAYLCDRIREGELSQHEATLIAACLELEEPDDSAS